MKLTVKTVYWIGFLLYVRLMFVIFYNLCFPLDVKLLTIYIAAEYLIDAFLIFFRYPSFVENLITLIHHCLVIIGVFNEYIFTFTTHTNFSYKITFAFIFAGGFDLICYSQIIFKQCNMKIPMYASAVVRTIFGLIYPFIIVSLGANWFTYLLLSFNMLIMVLVWYYKPENVFINPHKHP